MTDGKIQFLLYSVALSWVLWESYLPSVYIFTRLNIFFFLNCPLLAPAHVLSTASSILFLLFSYLIWVPGCYLHLPSPPLLCLEDELSTTLPGKPRQGSPSAANAPLPNTASGLLAEHSTCNCSDSCICQGRLPGTHWAVPKSAGCEVQRNMGRLPAFMTSGALWLVQCINGN